MQHERFLKSVAIWPESNRRPRVFDPGANIYIRHVFCCIYLVSFVPLFAYKTYLLHMLKIGSLTMPKGSSGGVKKILALLCKSIVT